MNFTFKECFINNIVIPGLYEIKINNFIDDRGYFEEFYSEKIFFENGLNLKFVQDNQSFSKKNVLRGLHFQTIHSQAKLIRVVTGKIFDVVVDLRNDSPTFGNYFGLILDSELANQLYIPKGFAHGFYVISDNTNIIYKCSDYYHKEDEKGIKWNDETLQINWFGMESDTPLLSKKDSMLQKFDNTKLYFDMNGNWIGE